MSLIMSWALHRASTGMMDSSSVCAGEGHCSNTCGNVCSVSTGVVFVFVSAAWL